MRFIVLLAALLAAATCRAEEVKVHPETMTKLAEDGLYLVSVKCVFIPIARPQPGFGTNPTRSVAEAIVLSTAPIGTTNTPSPQSIIGGIPVVSRTADSEGKTRNFLKNTTCSQYFVTSGQNDLFLTIAWSDHVTEAPATWLSVLGNLAGVIAPLLPLAPAGLGEVAKPFVTAIAAVGSPYSSLLSNFNTIGDETPTYTLGTGTMKIRTAAAIVTISVSRLSSIQSAFKVGSIKKAFDSSLPALGDQIRKDNTSCISIGRGMQDHQNLSHADVVYALARAYGYSGLGADKAASCLGAEYGPEVIQDPTWAHYYDHVLDENSFPSTQNPYWGYSGIRAQQLMQALTLYARTTDTKYLTRFFETKVQVSDLSGTTSYGGIFGSSFVASADVLTALVSKNFVRFGCPSDASTYTDGEGFASSVAFVAAPKKVGTYAYGDALLIRIWWRGNRNNPLISEMAITNTENAVISKMMTDSQCFPDVKFATN